MEFFEATFYGNTVIDWLKALAIIVGVIIVGKTVYWLFQKIVRKLTAKTKTKLDDIVLDMVEEPIVVILTVLGFWYALNTLNFEDYQAVGDYIGKVMQAAITLTVTWLFARLVNSLIEEYIVPLADKTETDLDDQLMPILRKGAKLTIWILGIIVALNNAGQDVGALLAGLGVGGLALAIAAQDTVANIFGGATIFADRPFVLGDRVRVEGYDGVIRDIGIRSSRLETRNGAMVTIPNSTFSSSPVENVSAGPAGRRIVLNIGLIYETTAEQMERAIEILGEIAAANESIGEDVKINFAEYGDFAMIIRSAYFVNPGAHFRNTQSAVNLEVLRRFGTEGLEMAFPTQTLYNINAGGSVS
ncbi:MAG: mechanosensitive ion channel family protein [bacterium]|nr:mechanosensitive ion channel family protein [bacterium]